MSRAKGTRFERAVADHLSEAGLSAERAPRWGARDKGDLIALDGGPLSRWTLELKAEVAACDHCGRQRLELARTLNEAAVEAAHNKTPHYAAIIKRRQRPIGDAYVVMPLDAFVEMLKGGGHHSG